MQNDNSKDFILDLEIFEINLDYYNNYWLNENVEKMKENYFFVVFNLDEEYLSVLAKICGESRGLIDMIKQANIFTIEQYEKLIHNTLMEVAKNDGIILGIK